MNVPRTLTVLLVITAAGCTEGRSIDLFNNMAERVLVIYCDHQVEIAPKQSAELYVWTCSEGVRIHAGGKIISYEAELSSQMRRYRQIAKRLFPMGRMYMAQLETNGTIYFLPANVVRPSSDLTSEAFVMPVAISSDQGDR